MLIPMKSHSLDESRNSDRHSRFRPSTYFYLHDRSWIAGGAPKNGWGTVQGSVTGEAQRPSAPGRRAGESPPAPRRTPLNNRSTSRAGWVRETASSGAVAHVSKHMLGTRRGGAQLPTGCRVWETTGPPSDAAG